MRKIYIHKHLYHRVGLNTLSYYVYLCQKFKHKKFQKNKSGLNRNTEYKACQQLIKSKLLTLSGNTYTLISNRQINEIYTIEKNRNKTFKSRESFNKQFKIFTSLTELNDIKYFLKSLPILNNLCKQQKQIERKQYFSNLKKRIDKGFGKLSEYKKLEKYLLTNNLKINYLQLSIKGMARITNVSNVSAIKYRKKLVSLGLIKTKRISEVLKTNATNLDLRIARTVYPYAKLFRNCITLDKSTEFQIGF